MYICFIIQKVPLQYFSDDEKFKVKKKNQKKRNIQKKKNIYNKIIA